MSTPKITRAMYDGNLNREAAQGPTNRRIVVLGTATDGEMYEPIKINSPADAESIFGSFEDGTLVRGLKEALDAQADASKAPDTWGMRIGDLLAKRASVTLPDVSGTDVLTIDAVLKADKYNQVTIGKANDANSQAWIYVYNPVTGLSSKFETTLTTDELAAAINSDPNTKDILYAVSATETNTAVIEMDTAAATLTAGVLSNIDLEAATGIDAKFPVAELDSVATISASDVKTISGTNRLVADVSHLIAEPDADAENSNNESFAAIVGGDDILANPNEVYYEGTESVVVAAVDGATAYQVDLDAEILGNAAVSKASSIVATDGVITEELVADPEAPVDLTNVAADSFTIPAVDLVGTYGFTEAADVTLTVTFSTENDPKTVVKAAIPANEFQYKLTDSAGTGITLGGIPSYPMKLRYAKKVTYESPNGYSIVGNVLAITVDDEVADEAKAIVNVYYKYSAGDVDFTASYSLSGGRNGNTMTNEQLKVELAKAYENFYYDFFDIMVVSGLTVDAVNKDGSSAGFAEQLSSFLDTYNGEVIAIIGYEPLVGSDLNERINRINDINDVSTGRVSQLTVPNLSGFNDANAGTILDSIDQPWMFAPDVEAIFSKNGVRYRGIATAAIAGLLSTIELDSALYTYTIPGVLGLRYEYTGKDSVTGEYRVDLLSDARIAVGKFDNGEVKLTDARTLAAPGSDYENLMTMLIIQDTMEIMRDVASGYKGKASSEARMHAWQTEQDNRIGEALVPTALRSFSAPLQMSSSDRVIGKVYVPLRLSPQFEIRDIEYGIYLNNDIET